MNEQSVFRNKLTKAAQLARAISDECGDAIDASYRGRPGHLPADADTMLRVVEGKTERLGERLAEVRQAINGGAR